MQIGKEDFIKLLNEHTEEILRHKDVQLESVLHELKVIAEVQIEHSRKFEVINRKLDEHTRILDEHTRILAEHTRILDEHTFKLDEHTRKIDATMEMVADNSENVVVIKSMLDCKVGFEPFKLLSGRVTVIEKKLLASN